MPTIEATRGVFLEYDEPSTEPRVCPRCAERSQVQETVNSTGDKLFRHVCRPCRWFTPYKHLDGSDQVPLSAHLLVTPEDLKLADEIRAKSPAVYT